MKRSLLLLAVPLALSSCGEHHDEETNIVKLGKNAKTKLEEIQVPLARLPEDATPLTMVLIQPGTFTMGSPEDERGRREHFLSEDRSTVAVTLAEGFYLGKYEVTQAQWEAVLGDNPSTKSWEAQKSVQSRSTYGVGDDYPVYYVSWDDCQAFIETLNNMDLGTFRLPTEAQWEYACRARTNTRFSFGDALECTDSGEDYCELLDQYMVWCGNDNNRSEEVGTKRPNPWGLHNMHGNLHEWCSDWIAAPFIDRATYLITTGRFQGSYRVLRSGHWLNSARNCRSASRTIASPHARNCHIGFRLVRELRKD